MKRNDVQDDLADGFSPSPLPPLGPDGGPTLELPRTMPDDPPRLCEAGPCTHYHRFVTQVDAARAIASEMGEHGQLMGEAPPAPYHEQTHHYCYPDVGIETNLGALPVVQCNRWDPQSTRAHDLRVDTWLKTEDGQAFQARMDAWKQAHQTSDADIASASSPTPAYEGDETP